MIKLAPARPAEHNNPKGTNPKLPQSKKQAKKLHLFKSGYECEIEGKQSSMLLALVAKGLPVFPCATTCEMSLDLMNFWMNLRIYLLMIILLNYLL